MIRRREEFRNIVLPCCDRAHMVRRSPFQPFVPVILGNKEGIFDED